MGSQRRSNESRSYIQSPRIFTNDILEQQTVATDILYR